ncbi:hypothetical protein [Streptomyces sp. KR80]|uniref:hypothetical protein n=1 Tax=Streptomyces sp. KR80 TaxID=3457426 RepID=UPI003FD466BC
MTKDHDVTGGCRPRALTPLDEAYVAHADALSELAHAILQNFPLQPRTRQPKGEVLEDALELRRLADQIVEKAVVVENERGASWTKIGAAASITKQSAHEKWGTVVLDWTLIKQRRASPNRSAAEIARTLDTWYAELYPSEPYAITAGLAATDPRNVVEQQAANANRAAAKRLYARLGELRAEDTAAYNAAVEAVGSKAHAAARTAMAEVYDQLAVAEPTIADDHRQDAAKQRALAADIANPPKDNDA